MNLKKTALAHFLNEDEGLFLQILPERYGTMLDRYYTVLDEDEYQINHRTITSFDGVIEHQGKLFYCFRDI